MPESAPAAVERPASALSTAVEGGLVARGVSVGFGDRTVLADVSMSSEPRTITALIGPTGCGKSTLLRSFNRLNDRVPGFWRTGSIAMGGAEISAMDPLQLRRRVGMVFQRPNPFPMSIRENVVAAVRTHRLAPKGTLPAVAERFLKEVGLWGAVADRLGDSPFRLSGGQQQLLCLARALAVEPEILLLDEPTSSLDPVTTEIVEDLLRALAERLTIVIVTHNLAQARRLSRATAFLYNGRLVEFGPTEQVFEAPSAPETVSYIGGRIG
ncbi:MAG TPA: phosphate ABC transporter ATP-binding protein [Acidimicrobiales bacterium]|nr:phosphate ABC transporter ATP-binding protein [Acidimicrobiales bacterium]